MIDCILPGLPMSSSSILSSSVGYTISIPVMEIDLKFFDAWFGLYFYQNTCIIHPNAFFPLSCFPFHKEMHEYFCNMSCLSSDGIFPDGHSEE